MDTHFFKVIEGDEIHGTSFRINVEFKEDSFNLTVIQKLKAWFVTVDKQMLCSHAKQLEHNFDEYYNKLKKYFRDSPVNIKFRINGNEFIVYSCLENNMKNKYFTCKLKEVNYSNCMENLVETFYTDRVNSLQRLTLIEEERYELQKSKDSLETQLNEFINRKKTDEEELYSKFVLVLNEKKKRIQHLNELLATFRRGRPTLNPPVTVKKRTKKHEPALQIEPHLKKEISDSESEDDYNTDEEKEKKLQNLSNETLQGDLNENRRIDDAIPSTSKCDIFSDNSPPRHLLSKRVKTESVGFSYSISSSHSVTKNISENDKNKDSPPRLTVENLPNVDFNTQELLDNI